ncbi:MFS transporter [Kineococcus rhizosphaerae]|uniref:Sugar phosphate permease n=1 Tax=Kineococcus rhizosphaerae TaxID=559628 RepID=A0A2T0R4C2_9ACTN|nr:MFS transporter [Kineococcus rhizosphaerae]PRY15218.1 sugar phosphate permease [Kineococcus rhizosphaerae]
MSQVTGGTSASLRLSRSGGGPLHTRVWVFLFLGWVVSYADRTVTGPIVSWMISERAGFIGDAANPATIGGLVGSMFFTGYMLTQYAGGRLGDRFGHRDMLVVSLVWAGLTTVLSGVVTGLVAFVAARVLTGLGEGVFYSNDRTLVIATTPPHRRTLGLGVVASGLTVGLTIGLVATPWLIDLGTAVGLGGHAWAMPLYVCGAATLVVGLLSRRFFTRESGRPLRLGRPAGRLALHSAPVFAAIVVLFLLSEEFGWPSWLTAVGSGVLAALMIAWVVRQVSRENVRGTPGRALLSRDAWLVYTAFIAVMWNLWFFSFWSVEIVREVSGSSLLTASLTAAFNAGAGIVGMPVGGWLADRQVRRGRGRKPLAIACAAAHALLAAAFGLTIASGHPSLWMMGGVLFTAGLFFNALQPIVHSITGDLVDAADRGSVFGIFNLVAEIGAVASPVVGGLLRDATGDWVLAVFVAAAVMAVSVVLYALVREKAPAALQPA